MVNSFLIFRSIQKLQKFSSISFVILHGKMQTNRYSERTKGKKSEENENVHILKQSFVVTSLKVNITTILLIKLQFRWAMKSNIRLRASTIQSFLI